MCHLHLELLCLYFKRGPTKHIYQSFRFDLLSMRTWYVQGEYYSINHNKISPFVPIISNIQAVIYSDLSANLEF
jgi:hypothetical protein